MAIDLEIEQSEKGAQEQKVCVERKKNVGKLPFRSRRRLWRTTAVISFDQNTQSPAIWMYNSSSGRVHSPGKYCLINLVSLLPTWGSFT